MSRGKMLFSCILSLLLAAQPVFAADIQGAKTTLENAVNRIMNCIRNPDWVNPATRGPLRQQVEDEVFHVFDFSEFSSRTVGPRWRTFSPDEKKRFSNAFAELLFNTYLNKVTGYNGEQISYTGERADQSGDRVEIRTAITMKNGKKTPVFYRMLPVDGTWRVYDVIIENISLVKNYRTQFQDILNTATPDQLIERIRQKAREVAGEAQNA